MSGIRTFLAALQFLTTLPVSAAFTSDEIGRSSPWFPFVGLAVGGVVVLADTADGFFSSRTPDRILEIMRDSRIGAMGVLALALVLGLKAAAIAERMISCTIPAMLAGLILGWTFTLALVATVSLLVAWWARTCRKSIGRMTGDTLGALSELGEALVLVVVAWNFSCGGTCG